MWNYGPVLLCCDWWLPTDAQNFFRIYMDNLWLRYFWQLLKIPKIFMWTWGLGQLRLKDDYRSKPTFASYACLEVEQYSCSTEELLKERNLYGHLYIKDKVMMTFLHGLAGSHCTANSISFVSKALHKQGAQDLTIIMYWIKLMSWSLLLRGIWMTSTTISTISLLSQWSHQPQVGKGLLCEQGARCLVSDLSFRWILSAFYSFLKTTYKARFT